MGKIKDNNGVLKEFNKNNSLANLYFLNFENTSPENWNEEDKNKYRASLRDMVVSVMEKCQDKNKIKLVKEALKDFDNDLVNKPLTRDQANIIYNNKVQKEKVTGRVK